MHYEISRAFTGRITPAQRRSSLFAEEPVVMGRVLRRGSKPRLLTEREYELGKGMLLRLQQAGAIKIKAVQDEAGAVQPESPASSQASEELEQSTAPSSPAVEPTTEASDASDAHRTEEVPRTARKRVRPS